MASTTCGRCGRLTHMSEVTNEMVDASSYDIVVTEQVFKCDNCSRLSLLSSVRPSLPTYQVDGFHGYDEWLPRHGERREFDDVPAHIASAATEATLCHSIGAYRAVGALTRAVIEATAKEKGIATGNLWSKIDAMYEARLIREHIKEAAHEVRHFGNDMAHGDFVDEVSKEEAAEAVELMAEVLNEVFQSPAKIERVKAARLAKKAVETSET